MTDIINPYEGVSIDNSWNPPTHYGQDYDTPKEYTGIAAADGIIHFVGGIYHSLVLELEDGRGINYEEWNNTVGTVPRSVKMFEAIVQNAQLRDGEYRSPHINGMNNWADNSVTNRIEFTTMVTETQEEAKTKMANPNQRTTIVEATEYNALVEPRGVVQTIPAGTVCTFVGFRSDAIPVGGTGVNFVGTDGGLWPVLQFDNPQVGSLPDLTGSPLTGVSAVATTPDNPPVVIPVPVDTDTTTKYTTPEKITTTPVVAINTANAGEIGTDLADVIDVTFTPNGRKRVYDIMTKFSVIMTPVYALALTSAAFFGGEVREDILIGTGVVLVVDKIVSALTTQLAAKNVGI